jgi:hypothetical protein
MRVFNEIPLNFLTNIKPIANNRNNRKEERESEEREDETEEEGEILEVELVFRLTVEEEVR